MSDWLIKILLTENIDKIRFALNNIQIISTNPHQRVTFRNIKSCNVIHVASHVLDVDDFCLLMNKLPIETISQALLPENSQEHTGLESILYFQYFKENDIEFFNRLTSEAITNFAQQLMLRGRSLLHLLVDKQPFAILLLIIEKYQYETLLEELKYMIRTDYAVLSCFFERLNSYEIVKALERIETSDLELLLIPKPNKQQYIELYHIVENIDCFDYIKSHVTNDKFLTLCQHKDKNDNYLIDYCIYYGNEIMIYEILSILSKNKINNRLSDEYFKITTNDFLFDILSRLSTSTIIKILDSIEDSKINKLMRLSISNSSAPSAFR